MPSSRISHVVPVRTDISEEHIASIIRVTRISELRTMFAATSNQSMLQIPESNKLYTYSIVSGLGR
jgi:hypothetical protein